MTLVTEERNPFELLINDLAGVKARISEPQDYLIGSPRDTSSV